MRKSVKQFQKWKNKAVTLLGMSGVGKTTLSCMLKTDNWFHYSGDYRIGTRYLDEHILDSIKIKAMRDDVLSDLICSDSIYSRNNITINHLQALSQFIGKIGNPALGGLTVLEFKYRQNLFRLAEVRAMQDISIFMKKARSIYNCSHFLNDAGGSICSSLNLEKYWKELSDSTLILYLKASDKMEKLLFHRFQRHPKPLLYEEHFFDKSLDEYLKFHEIESSNHIHPDRFVNWLFPKLINYRKPKYKALADQYGYTIDASQISQFRDAEDFTDCICDAIASYQR